MTCSGPTHRNVANRVLSRVKRSQLTSKCDRTRQRTTPDWPSILHARLVSVLPIGHDKPRASQLWLSAANSTSIPAYGTRQLGLTWDQDDGICGRSYFLIFPQLYVESIFFITTNCSLIHVGFSRLIPHWTLNLQVSKAS